MRTLLLSTVFVAIVCAQNPSATPPSPPTPAAPAASSTPATPPAIITPDTIVAEVDGKKYTAGEVDTLLKIFPPQMQRQVRADLSRAVTYALTMRYLASQAEKNKLQDQSP
jgi:hypothetical protein